MIAISAERHRVPGLPAQLRHVLEVHAVDAGDQRRHGRHRHVGRDLAHVLVLAHADLGEVGLEDAREQVAVALELVVSAQQVVVDVAEVGPHLGVDHVVLAAGEPVDRLHERSDAVPELEDLALELVDALGRVGAHPGEDLVLDLVDVLAQTGDRGRVVVHHPVDDRVQHRARPVLQQLGVLLELATHAAQLAGLAVAHGDDVVVAEEDQDLAELDDLGRVDVASRLEDDEDHVGEDLELGALVRVDRVLHGQRVQVELAADRLELLLGGLVQADPGEGVRLAARLHRLVDAHVAVQPPPALVDRRIYDHERSLRASATACSRVLTSPT